MASGADPNQQDHTGWTALHEAANNGHTECVRALLEYGSSLVPCGPGIYLLAKGDGGTTPLHDSASCGNLQISQMIFDAGGMGLFFFLFLFLKETDSQGFVNFYGVLRLPGSNPGRAA